jgi:NitT/TauT family transport system permease protein
VSTPAHSSALQRVGYGALSQLAGLLVLLVLWFVVVRLPVLHFRALPSPYQAARVGAEAVAGPEFWSYTWKSLDRVLVGFGLALVVGTLIGLAMGRLRAARELLFPALEVMRPIPPLAWGPLAIVALPSVTWGITFVTFIGAFFPILISTMDGASRIDELRLRAVRCLGAGRLGTFANVVWPATTPAIGTGASIGLGLAWMNLVAAEIIAGDDGLGYRLWDAFQKANYAVVAFLMIAIGVVGWASTALVSHLAQRAVRWRVDKEREDS